MMDEDIVFPPPFAVRHLLPGLDPAREAATAAACGELGAADALWNAEAGRLRLALVLEPEEPVPQEEIVEVMQTALVTALAALLPPQVAIAAAPDGTVRVNAGRLAMVRCIPPPTAPAKGTKDPQEAADILPELPWLVLAATVHLHRAPGQEGGETPDDAVLAEEGGADLEPVVIVAAILQRFLLALAAWQDGGRSALAAMRRGC